MPNYDEAARKLRQQITSQDVVTSVTFVTLAQNGMLDETTIVEHADLFTLWDKNWRGKAGDIVSDEGKLFKSIHDVSDEGKLFKSIHDVSDAGQNRKPSTTPSMWTPIGNPAEEWPEWSQPLGGHDAYSLGDKVSYNGKHWVSIADANIWQPGVYGWEEQK